MPDQFIPGPDTTPALRQAFGQFATGVTVVTTDSARGPIGITANSFASVSLDPALLLWCPAKSSQRHDAFASAAHFAIHVMSAGQDDVIRAFAQSAEGFGACAYELSHEKVPLIDGCPVRFECTTRDRIDAGDHTVIIGRVTRVTASGSEDARVFLRGGYGRFTPDAS